MRNRTASPMGSSDSSHVAQSHEASSSRLSSSRGCQLSRGSSVPSEGEHLLAEMKRIAAVNALQRDSATLSPQRASRLSIRPMRMPSLGSLNDILQRKRKEQRLLLKQQAKGRARRQQEHQQKEKRNRAKQGEGKGNVRGKGRGRERGDKCSDERHMSSSPFSAAAATATAIRLPAEDRARWKKEGKDVDRIEQMLNASMTTQQKTELTKYNLWEREKKRGNVADHSVWNRWCDKKIQNAPKEMRRHLLANEDFHLVEHSSMHCKKKKIRNDNAKNNLLNFLEARDKRRDGDMWLSYAKQAAPKLTSQWFQYLDRIEKKRPMELL